MTQGRKRQTSWSVWLSENSFFLLFFVFSVPPWPTDARVWRHIVVKLCIRVLHNVPITNAKVLPRFISCLVYNNYFSHFKAFTGFFFNQHDWEWVMMSESDILPVGFSTIFLLLFEMEGGGEESACTTFAETVVSCVWAEFNFLTRKSSVQLFFYEW